MSTERFDMETIEKEVRELILNSKSKRTTIFEPCNDKNILECLKSVQEELFLCGIKYRFNPYIDIDGSDNTIQTMVRLINATWNLLMQYKEIAVNTDKLKERNYALQQNNFYLSNMIDQLKKDIEIYQNKQKHAEESKRQVIYKFEKCQKELSKANEDLKRSKKQNVSKEDQLNKQIKKLENEYLQLQDKARRNCGIFTSRNESSSRFIEEFKSREKKYKETILKLQENNKRLLMEVINLKDDIINEDKDEFE